ncbi:sigma-E processing peptidase SpoIIGA [Paenibacillus sp. SYP-B3998]|uniref:Sporulation sigma-E factor-processing peptidase n=1 Tax=Paenibacillus sp. SYP-B3998 TaxID=2678564 RepID=A0A6G3ZUM5_9BACL|nr:sigma-E processing peptidase SpoIIGA [Paenibacillus sp. SYP-B3998]
MVVYADLIFLLNFLMDAAMLMVTAKTRKISFKWWRLVGSAFLGAMYVVMMFLPVPTFLFTFSVKCMFCMGMIMTAFGFGSLQNFLRNLGAFLLVNFAVAGGMFGIHYVLASSSEVMKGIVFTQSGAPMFQVQVGIMFIAVLILPLIWWFRTVFSSVKQREDLTSFLAEVTIYVEDFTASCKGLIDTGNHLYDPLTRTPVMIMEVSEWGDVLPGEWLQRIRSADVDQIISGLGTEEFIWQDRLRLVPYRGVNRNTQFMLAIKPDKVVIVYNNKQIEASKVLIGLDGGKLCSDGSYQAIIHPTLMSI